MTPTRLASKPTNFDSQTLRSFPNVILTNGDGFHFTTSANLLAITCPNFKDVVREAFEVSDEPIRVVLSGYSKRMLQCLNEFIHEGVINITGTTKEAKALLNDLKLVFHQQFGVNVPRDFWTFDDLSDGEEESQGVKSETDDAMDDDVNKADSEFKIEDFYDAEDDFIGEHILVGDDRRIESNGVSRRINFPCPVCGKVIKERSSWIAHIKKKHPEEEEAILKRLTCYKCGVSFKFIGMLHQHQTKCTGDNYAPIRSGQKENRRRINFDCPVCSIVIRARPSWVQHIKKEHPEAANEILNRLTCPKCHVTFKFIGHLQRHQSQCQSTESVRITSSGARRKINFPCPVCSEVIRERRTWIKHLNREHPSEAEKVLNERKCEKCNRTFKTVGNYQHHKEHCDLEETSVDCMRTEGSGVRRRINFPCPVCDQVIRERAQWVKHLKQEHIEEAESILNNLTCDICDRTFKHIGQLHCHQARGSQCKQQVICDQCGRTFESARSLRSHKASSHQKNKVTPCDECGKVFESKSLVTQHVRAEHKMKCVECDRPFSSKQKLTEHLLNIHTPYHERPFICHVCGKGFGARSAFVEHTNTHSNEKPYKCRICDYESVSSSVRVKHEKLKHNYFHRLRQKL